MYILFNKDGSIFDTNVSEYVMQGSNLVNVIYVAFVDSEYLDWSASGNFTLPDESNSVLVGVSATFLYKGVNYTGWKITLTNNETKYNGTLGVSINLIKNEQILYTYLYNITINETGYPLDGEWNVNINYAQFNTLMAQIATKFGVGTTALTVEELPLQGSENIIYYLDKNGYYEQYMFNGSEYVLLGTTIFKINIPTINVSNSGTFSEGDYQTLEENHTISLVYSNNECILHQAKSALDTTSLYFTGITTNNNVVPTFICLKVLENRNYTLTVKQLVDTDSEQTLRNKTISNTTINNSTINGTNINNSHLNNTTSIGTFKVESGSITFGEESDPNQTTMYQDNLFVRNMNDRMQFKAGVLDYSKNAGSYGHYLFNDVPNQNVYLAYSVSNENSNIDNAFLGVRNDINSAKGDISSLQSDIDDINNELSTINGSITTIKNDVSTLKSNVSTLQGNVGTIQGDVSTINGEIDTINSDLDKKLNKLQLAQGNLLYARVNGIDLGAVYDTQAQANTIVARDNQGHVIGATPTDPTHLTTKSYVDSAIGSVSTIKFSIVSELPSTGESNIIYLVPNTTSSEKNVYDEYIWVNNAFEIIGSTAIDLTNYAKLNGDNIFTGVQYFNNTSGILIDGFKLNNAFLTNWQTKINKIDGIETDITSIESNVNSLTTKVSTNTTNISTNTSDITQVKQDLNSKLDKTTKAGAYVNQGDSVLNIPISYAPAASAIPRYNGAGALRSESVDWSTATATTVINKNMFEDNFKATFNEKCIPTITISSLSGTLSDSDYEKLVNSDMAKIVSPLGSFVAFKYTFPQQQNNLYYYTYETNESGTTCYSFVVTNGTTKTFVVNDYTVGGGGSVETISVTVTVDQQYPIEPFKQYTATISKADFDKVKEGVAVNIILNLNGQVIPYCSIPTVTSYDNFYFYFYLPDILGILSEYQNVADFFLSFEASGETITGTFMAVADTDTFTPETITITDIQETIIGRKGTFNSADYSKLKVGVPINLNIENEVYGCLVMYQDRNANFGVFEPMQGDMWSFTDTGVCIGAKQYPKFNTQNTFKSIQHFNGGLTAGENNELTINSNGALSITDSNGTVGLSGQGLMYRVGGSTNLLKMPTDSVSNNTEIVSKGYLGSQFTIQTTTVSKDFNRGVQSGQIAGRLDTGLTDENIIITSMYDTTNQVEFMDPYYDGTKWYATAICVAQGITGASNVQIKYIRLP